MGYPFQQFRQNVSKKFGMFFTQRIETKQNLNEIKYHKL